MQNTAITAMDSFSIEVEHYSTQYEVTLLEAIVTLSENYGIGDKIASYISRPLKEKLHVESCKLGLFKNNNLEVTLDDWF